jgi:hypothetical protein
MGLGFLRINKLGGSLSGIHLRLATKAQGQMLHEVPEDLETF